MSNKKYAIWNNKGGVGKTFLTYVLSVEYAIANPDKYVVVIDACPQANVSEIILGGNGKGEECLAELTQNDKTIAGYIKTRFQKSPYSKLGSEYPYFVQANTKNEKMPENLFLLPGDIDLDICSRLIAHIGTSPMKNAWKVSRSLLIDLIESFEITHQNKEIAFFIDCNPSFANYTELALLSSNRIIVPCTADSSSIRGIKNLIKLIHNIQIGKQDFPDEFLHFYSDAQTVGFQLPKLHLFIQNRSRTLDKSATRAYQAHADEIEKIAMDLSQNHQGIFTPVFEGKSRVGHVKDGNTLASIINHEGCPLSELKHAKYDIYGQATQTNPTQIKTLNGDIQNIIQIL